jgi:hypothetical protein
MTEENDDELWPDPEFAQRVAGAISMDQKRKDELWNRFSTICRNVLTRVLEWPEESADYYIEELRQRMELNFKEPLTNIFGFFYDPASAYLVGPILGEGLQDRILQCNSEKANPSFIFQQLVEAIFGSHFERETESPDFNWDLARDRYRNERRKVEQLLARLENAK